MVFDCALQLNFFNSEVVNLLKQYLVKTKRDVLGSSASADAALKDASLMEGQTWFRTSSQGISLELC